MLDEISDKCWMKVYIAFTCHPTCFIQHVCPFILSFNVKSKMATDMLLSVLLSELVDSDDEKLHRGKTREWISFLNLSMFPFSFSAVFNFFYSSSYSSPLCSCNLDRWSESSLLLFKLILM